jgi:DUF1365 family protein
MRIEAIPHLGCGRVWHGRLHPVRHVFGYRVFFLLLPMRALAGRRDIGAGVRRNRFAWVSFHDRDHGDGRRDALQWFEEILQQEGIHDADGEVWLQTYPRMLGYVFNPVSFWFALRRDGSLAAVIAEVNNTFGERHCYLLHGANVGWGAQISASKAFHVSPFCPVSGDYLFRFTCTAAEGSRAPASFHANVDLVDGPRIVLRTGIGGELQPLGRGSLARALLSMPLMSLGVIVRIHVQAMRLALKFLPVFRKPHAPDRFVTR